VATETALVGSTHGGVIGGFACADEAGGIPIPFLDATLSLAQIYEDVSLPHSR
jgi:hypothetical protein